MSDRIELLVNNQKITAFSEYEVDSDLYLPADAFSLSFGPPRGLILDEGMPCRLLVNGEVALIGVIDSIDEKDGKSGSTTRVSGRDLMGLVVDQYVQEFVDLSAASLPAAADRLLKKVPLIDRKQIRLEKGAADGPQTRHLRPGDTTFEVLRDLALRRGLLFWCETDGTFVFGKPLAKGRSDFSLILDPDANRTNLIDLSRARDMSERYQLIMVVASADGDDAVTGGQHASATVTDTEVPLRRVKVEVFDADTMAPALRARQLKEQQRAAGRRYVATVARHSQNGLTWTPNRLCAIDNKVRGYRDTCLIYGRTLRLSKEAGQTTEVRLGLPGVVQ